MWSTNAKGLFEINNNYAKSHDIKDLSEHILPTTYMYMYLPGWENHLLWSGGHCRDMTTSENRFNFTVELG